MANNKHVSLGNERVDGGIVNRCSCGWVSGLHFSSAGASCEGQEHRDQFEQKEDEDED